MENGKNLRNLNRRFKCSALRALVKYHKSSLNGTHNTPWPLMNAARTGNSNRRLCATLKILFFPFFFFYSFSLASLLSNSHCTRGHAIRRTLDAATMPLTEFNWTEWKQLFFFALVYRAHIFRSTKNAYTCIQSNWLNGLCVTVVRLLAATTNSYTFSIHAFSVGSIIWFHFLFVCVRGTEKTTKK